jgi:alkylation response protein AidB-like acyl-CoA dehydrogenase
MDFLQTPPALPDAWAGDRVLRESVRFLVGDEAFEAAQPDLAEMGALATSPRVLALAYQAENEPPRHIPYSAWGERIDEIKVSPAYEELGKLGVARGVTALPYEAAYGPHARVVWAALVTMWGPSSALYSCPVAMTDAAARTLLVHGDASDLEVVERLTTRDTERAWTSGQWMTEMTGGSDVGRTETVARRDDSGNWRLFGTKWFTSATTSEVALTLARAEGAEAGSRGLSLFRIHRMNPDGSRNNIFVRRLKDKLGTRSLPTAELELQGALAHPVGEPEGNGVRRIATMLNLTRIHNSIGSAGSLARGLAWARAFAATREVFGKPLYTLPAHQATLADLAVDHAAAVALVMRCAELTGKVENDLASEEDVRILRGLTPITKLATARWAVAGAAEAMEALGGVGYCEDSGMPALVRNTHVMPIWEGTTNVLSLDLLRATERSGAAFAIIADARASLEGIAHEAAVAEAAVAVESALRHIELHLEAVREDVAGAQAGARSIALALATTYACARLCLQGSWAVGRGDRRTAMAATRLARRGLVPLVPVSELELAMEDGSLIGNP